MLFNCHKALNLDNRFFATVYVRRWIFCVTTFYLHKCHMVRYTIGYRKKSWKLLMKNQITFLIIALTHIMLTLSAKNSRNDNRIQSVWLLTVCDIQQRVHLVLSLWVKRWRNPEKVATAVNPSGDTKNYARYKFSTLSQSSLAWCTNEKAMLLDVTNKWWECRTNRKSDKANFHARHGMP